MSYFLGAEEAPPEDLKERAEFFEKKYYAAKKVVATSEEVIARQEKRIAETSEHLKLVKAVANEFKQLIMEAITTRGENGTDTSAHCRSQNI